MSNLQLFSQEKERCKRIAVEVCKPSPRPARREGSELFLVSNSGAEEVIKLVLKCEIKGGGSSREGWQTNGNPCQSLLRKPMEVTSAACI